MSAAKLQTSGAILLGLVLGWKTASFANDSTLALPFLVVASIINPIVVCLIARGWWALVGLVPTLAWEAFLIHMQYQHAHLYNGVDWSAFIRGTQGLGSLMACISFLSISLIPSIIIQIYRTPDSVNFFDPSKRNDA